MILLLFELYVSIMNLFMFQENYGIYLSYKEPKEDNWGSCQGEWNLDFCGYGMQSQQESLLHLVLFVPSIPRQGITYVVIRWCKNWVEQRYLPEHHQVRVVQGCNEDSDITMFGCDWVDNKKGRSSTLINIELWRKNCSQLQSFYDQSNVSSQGS